MSLKRVEFQPGAILHDVVSGAFRMQGTTLEQWCKSVGLKPMSVRYAMYGVIRSDVGQAVIEKAVDAAGRDIVTGGYTRRMTEHYAAIQRVAA